MNDSFAGRDYPEEGQSRKRRSAPYLRISNKEKEGGQSIEIQLERIKDAAGERRWELLDPYIDDGYSGELLARPGIDRLLDEIEQNRIEVVPITEPDRLARGDLYLQKFLEEKIKERGAFVDYLSLPPATNEDEQLGHDVRGVVSGWERLKIKQRTMRGKLKKARSGFIVGGRAPYGFHYSAKTEQTPGGYEPLEEEIHWVKEMFRWYAWEGLSVEGVTERLTKKKVPTQTGNRLWRTSTVHHILTNETYAGIAYYNRRRSVPPKNPQGSTGYRRLKNTSRQTRARKEWIPIPVTPFIDREIWERTQQKLKRNAKESPRNTRHPYLLRGKVVCGECGLPCYGSVSRTNLFYQCSNRHRMFPLPKRCSARSVSVPSLDSTVWQALLSALSHPDIILSQLQEVKDAEATTRDYRKEELKRVKVELEKKKRGERRLIELYKYDQEMSLEHYRESMDKTRAEIANNEKEKENLERQTLRTVNLEEIETDLKFLSSDISSRLHMLSFEDKRKIIELLIEKVTVTEKKVMIEAIVPPGGDVTPTPPNSVAIASQSSLCEVQNHTNWYKLVRKENRCDYYGKLVLAVQRGF